MATSSDLATGKTIENKKKKERKKKALEELLE